MKERFGAYTLLRRLAVGGMAEIFLARLAYAAPAAPCLVIKRILPHLSRDARFVRMFIDESRLAVDLVHRNIVRTLDFGRVGAAHYLTMAYVPGVDLLGLLNRGFEAGEGLDVAASAVVGLDMAQGLSYAHRFVSADGTAQHVVHRDVSPHNVMVHQDGSAMVMDFGIAKAALCASRTATGAGTIKGKLCYMAPEQARGERITQAVDQYALGVVLWECLTGRRLFAEAPERRLIEACHAPAVPRLEDVAPHVPAPLSRAVMRALMPAPERRYADVGAFAEALRSVLATLPEGEAGGRASLSARVRAETHRVRAEAHVHWSWRHGQGACGTRVQAPSRDGRQGTLAEATPASPGPAWPQEAKALGGKAMSGSRQHQALAARPRSKGPTKPWRRLLLARRAWLMRLWWALYAAACGAAGHALWPQALAPFGDLSEVCVARACMP